MPHDLCSIYLFCAGGEKGGRRFYLLDEGKHCLVIQGMIAVLSANIISLVHVSSLTSGHQMDSLLPRVSGEVYSWC